MLKKNDDPIFTVRSFLLAVLVPFINADDNDGNGNNDASDVFEKD